MNLSIYHSIKTRRHSVNISNTLGLMICFSEPLLNQLMICLTDIIEILLWIRLHPNHLGLGYSGEHKLTEHCLNRAHSLGRETKTTFVKQPLGQHVKQ